MPNELGDFLRARRAAVPPQPSTNGAAGRRRITGLRREEVAASAGISVDYYIRLEQGRERHPSDAVINALAGVLDLTDDGKSHLFRLRGTPATPSRDSRASSSALAERMSALVRAVAPNPAYVLDRFSNMIAANDEGLALYDGFDDLAPEQRNTCRYLMTDARASQIFVEWEELARGAVAHLRAANADDLHDPRLQTLVADLSAQSPLFTEWWAEHIVQQRRASIKHIRTATGEVIARRYEVLHIPDEELRMTLWLPQT
ncbi:MAG TPA: helix-turn-helix transcriptional regulator [Candidatus Agrococcus pullicola]|uniref:Helix-turn-helix transcriptional regulator n=1 Tax=Candidatus Agrococcus pullicola TaxID=2838429 RepID=A0A9D1YXM5_9MICO|nr:helix-turn-helix transcriptional regulator [Candidatus Agrococcus pullicola]